MVTFTTATYDDLWLEAADILSTDSTEEISDCPRQIGRGYTRDIQLRSGLSLNIFDAQLSQAMRIWQPERPDWLRYHFHIFGHHQDKFTTVGDRAFAVYGSGLSPLEALDSPPQRALEITIEINPETFLEVAGDADGQLPVTLRHLVEPIDRQCYSRVAAMTPAIESNLWQILRCPFHGIVKRLFLEAKVLEVVSLVLVQEQEIWGESRRLMPLKFGTIDRIEYAKTLLLRNLHQPLSISELAQLVKLNECTLKRGFRQVFGTSIFSYLRDYRLEQARELLVGGDMKVSEVMAAVGFADRRYFATVFRKKFGVVPKDLLYVLKS
jgi:AraC-like DNA-binding protein